MQTSAQRALHNNLGKCEALALAVSTAVNSALQDDWRNNAIKTRRMRLAKPLVGDDEAVRLAVVEKLGWVKRQTSRFVQQPRQSQREMVSGESHYF